MLLLVEIVVVVVKPCRLGQELVVDRRSCIPSTTTAPSRYSCTIRRMPTFLVIMKHKDYWYLPRGGLLLDDVIIVVSAFTGYRTRYVVVKQVAIVMLMVGCWMLESCFGRESQDDVTDIPNLLS